MLIGAQPSSKRPQAARSVHATTYATSAKDPGAGPEDASAAARKSSASETAAAGAARARAAAVCGSAGERRAAADAAVAEQRARLEKYEQIAYQYADKMARLESVL